MAALLRVAALGVGLAHARDFEESRWIDAGTAFLGGAAPRSSPALWPSLLSGLNDLCFALWSAFGLRRSAPDFAALYGFDPSIFYLIARTAAAAASIAALAVLAACERRVERGRWPYGALMLAFTPLLVELSWTGKPDSLMLLLVSAGWACALRFQEEGRRAWLLAAAAACGAACATRYSAASAALCVPLAWALRRGGPPPLSWLLQAGLAGLAALAAGSPSTALDLRGAFMDWADRADLDRLRSSPAAAAAKVHDLWTFGGEGSPAGLAAGLGLLVLLRRQPRRVALLALPTAAAVAALADGGAGPRALLGVFPALALLAGEGLALLGGRAAWRRVAVAALAIAPGALLSASLLAEFRRPDTRTLAGAWLQANVSAGATVLLDLPHVSPRPRRGWRVYRFQRGGADPEFLDVRPGLDPARAVRAGWVVTSSLGADPQRSRELASFFSELAAEAELAAEFPSIPGETIGPWLRVWRLRR